VVMEWKPQGRQGMPREAQVGLLLAEVRSLPLPSRGQAVSGVTCHQAHSKCCGQPCIGSGRHFAGQEHPRILL
jgi:hypothetical protein